MIREPVRPVRWAEALVRPLRAPSARLGIRRGRGELDGRRDPLGPAGEKLAARLLKREGYLILGRNVRVPMGEADIVAVTPDRLTVVIVEVKTRRTGDGDLPPEQRAPEASVTAEKRGKLALIARHLARANRWKLPPRIDVIAVEWPEQGKPTLRHHVGAVGI
jgi:putative endonuclease